MANDLAGEALASETAKNPMKGEGSTRSSRRVRGRLASASRLTTLDHFLRFVNGVARAGDELRNLSTLRFPFLSSIGQITCPMCSREIPQLRQLLLRKEIGKRGWK